jgi:hypothetical protein
MRRRFEPVFICLLDNFCNYAGAYSVTASQLRQGFVGQVADGIVRLFNNLCNNSGAYGVAAFSNCEFTFFF